MSELRCPNCGSTHICPGEKPEVNQSLKEEHSIICSVCNKHDTVPFEPRPNSIVKCRECYAERKT